MEQEPINMKKILVFTDKYESRYYDASTPSLEELAFWNAFIYNNDNEYYEDLESKEEKELYTKIINGEGKLAKRLLELRRHYEYEGWTIEEVN